MLEIQFRSDNVAREADGSENGPGRPASNGVNVKSRIPFAPILVTLGTVAVAALLSWATWQVYMGAPWTRDGTVRAYVVTMAPEGGGRIVKLASQNNKSWKRGGG